MPTVDITGAMAGRQLARASTILLGQALDSAGNLYIADSGNSVVRKVDAHTQIITTVAGNNGWDYKGDGGPATSAALNYPWGLALDPTGNLYIADANNNVVRKVDAVDGTISTVAGGNNAGGNYSGDHDLATKAGLDYPTGVVLDAAGNLYIADANNNVIRKVDARRA